jgi:proteasome beta subunit
MGTDYPRRATERATDGHGTELETGTTLVGVVAEDAVVLASDRRASLGRMVASKDVRKVVPLADRAAMAFAGSMSGAQSLAAQLASRIRLYETRRGREMSTGALATYVANLLRQGGEGFRTAPLLAGVDGDGPHLYDVDAGGSLTESEYAAGGSGTPYAYGLLESEYESGLDPEAARSLAVRTVGVASERDLASGNGVVLGTVTRDGIEVETLDEPNAAA